MNTRSMFPGMEQQLAWARPAVAAWQLSRMCKTATLTFWCTAYHVLILPCTHTTHHFRSAAQCHCALHVVSRSQGTKRSRLWWHSGRACCHAALLEGSQW